jgi:hypothetical protein
LPGWVVTKTTSGFRQSNASVRIGKCLFFNIPGPLRGATVSPRWSTASSNPPASSRLSEGDGAQPRDGVHLRSELVRGDLRYCLSFTSALRDVSAPETSSPDAATATAAAATNLAARGPGCIINLDVTSCVREYAARAHLALRLDGGLFDVHSADGQLHPGGGGMTEEEKRRKSIMKRRGGDQSRLVLLVRGGRGKPAKPRPATLYVTPEPSPVDWMAAEAAPSSVPETNTLSKLVAEDGSEGGCTSRSGSVSPEEREAFCRYNLWLVRAWQDKCVPYWLEELEERRLAQEPELPPRGVERLPRSHRVCGVEAGKPDDNYGQYQQILAGYFGNLHDIHSRILVFEPLDNTSRRWTLRFASAALLSDEGEEGGLVGYLRAAGPAVRRRLNGEFVGAAPMRLRVQWRAGKTASVLYCVPLFGGSGKGAERTGWMCVVREVGDEPLWPSDGLSRNMF